MATLQKEEAKVKTSINIFEGLQLPAAPTHPVLLSTQSIQNDPLEINDTVDDTESLLTRDNNSSSFSKLYTSEVNICY